MVSNNLKEDGKEYYISARFPKQAYKDCVGSFYTNTISRLKELGNEEDVRIVFWFDN